MSPGEKVVCVRDDYPNGTAILFDPAPIKGRVYVLRDVLLDDAGELVVRLVGVVGAFNPYVMKEYALDANRFRRLEDIKAENRAAMRAGV